MCHLPPIFHSVTQRHSTCRYLQPHCDMCLNEVSGWHFNAVLGSYVQIIRFLVHTRAQCRVTPGGAWMPHDHQLKTEDINVQNNSLNKSVVVNFMFYTRHSPFFQQGLWQCIVVWYKYYNTRPHTGDGGATSNLCIPIYILQIRTYKSEGYQTVSVIVSKYYTVASIS